jgi:CubicO group peptidase (beta-lactamase class C family)
MNPQFDLQRLQQAARVAEEAVATGPQPSVVVAVANSRETLWTHVVPGEDHVRLDSIFEIASITKSVTATAVMRLVEEGRLMLNLPVARYLPEFAANGTENVTTWQLLTHSSGLQEKQYYDELWAKGLPVLPEYLYEACCRAGVDFEPGTAFRYTTLSFSALGELITQLSGEPYADYMRRHIFHPLGMLDTAFAPRDRARMAPLYDLGPPEVVEAFIGMAEPGGGLWSTAADLIAFGQAYLRRGTVDGYHLLSPASIDLMTQNYSQGQTQFESSDRFNYGLGWGKPEVPPDGSILASERAFGHGGASGTLLWIDPEYDLVYVWLSNRWDMQDPSKAADRALNAVYGAIDVKRNT